MRLRRRQAGSRKESPLFEAMPSTDEDDPGELVDSDVFAAHHGAWPSSTCKNSTTVFGSVPHVPRHC
jgi:hypothetical protein